MPNLLISLTLTIVGQQFALSEVRFGPGQTFRCRCTNDPATDDSCDPITGECPRGCYFQPSIFPDRWINLGCQYENVALGCTVESEDPLPTDLELTDDFFHPRLPIKSFPKKRITITVNLREKWVVDTALLHYGKFSAVGPIDFGVEEKLLVPTHNDSVSLDIDPDEFATVTELVLLGYKYKPCPIGRWGAGCQKHCDHFCQPNQECNDVTGACFCLDGLGFGKRSRECIPVNLLKYYSKCEGPCEMLVDFDPTSCIPLQQGLRFNLSKSFSIHLIKLSVKTPDVQFLVNTFRTGVEKYFPCSFVKSTTHNEAWTDIEFECGAFGGRPFGDTISISKSMGGISSPETDRVEICEVNILADRGSMYWTTIENIGSKTDSSTSDKSVDFTYKEELGQPGGAIHILKSSFTAKYPSFLMGASCESKTGRQVKEVNFTIWRQHPENPDFYQVISMGSLPLSVDKTKYSKIPGFQKFGLQTEINKGDIFALDVSRLSGDSPLPYRQESLYANRSGDRNSCHETIEYFYFNEPPKPNSDVWFDLRNEMKICRHYDRIELIMLYQGGSLVNLAHFLNTKYPMPNRRVIEEIELDKIDDLFETSRICSGWCFQIGFEKKNEDITCRSFEIDSNLKKCIFFADSAFDYDYEIAPPAMDSFHVHYVVLNIYPEPTIKGSHEARVAYGDEIKVGCKAMYLLFYPTGRNFYITDNQGGVFYPHVITTSVSKTSRLDIIEASFTYQRQNATAELDEGLTLTCVLEHPSLLFHRYTYSYSFDFYDPMRETKHFDLFNKSGMLEYYTVPTTTTSTTTTSTTTATSAATTEGAKSAAIEAGNTLYLFIIGSALLVVLLVGGVVMVVRGYHVMKKLPKRTNQPEDNIISASDDESIFVSENGPDNVSLSYKGVVE